MISNGGTFNAEWLSQQFKVMNWNILADLYATEAVYPYCEKWALSWSWRKHLIIKELKSMTADIITLQEVQKDAYDEWFRPELQEAGYEGLFQQKRRDPIFHRGKYTSEGCATFYKTTRFKRVDKHVVDYDKLTHSECRSLPEEGQPKDPQRLSRGNIALAIVLEDLHIKATHSGQPSGPSGGHMLCVMNTHILCDPGSADVKLWQAYLLLQTLKLMPYKNVPLLICGDFNSTPESAVYEYMRRGSVRTDHEDLSRDPCLFKHLNLEHSLQLATAYETCNRAEAQYTNYTEDFKGTLDYIWFSQTNLAVLAISQVDEENQLTQETALPSSTRPSDHVSLVATFMFRDTPADADTRPGSHADSRLRGLAAFPGTAVSTASANGSSPYHLGGAAAGSGMPWMTPSEALYNGRAIWSAAPASTHDYKTATMFAAQLL